MQDSTGGDGPAPLRLFLLGGFRADRAGQAVPESAWQRRSAKVLVKLLATEPSHRLHREQVQELLWPESEPESADNSFRKALHLARHALEPELPHRGSSAYLYLVHDVVALAADRVWIDADHFQTIAAAALADGEVAAFEGALAAYGGELLPEDRYEDWVARRREALADLHARLLMALAGLLERRGAYDLAVDRLQQVLRQDPAREEAHRCLMRLFALSGSRHQALRQYQVCREALQRHLDAGPEPATEALHQDILAGRIGPTSPVGAAVEMVEPPALPPAIRRQLATPMVGRERALELLMDSLARAADGNGDVVVVGGEAGVGKTRLVAEAARAARSRGAVVLWGACYEQEGQLPYGPFVEALDGYLAGRPPAERQRLAAAQPELARLVPSLVPPPSPRVESATAEVRPESERARLFAAIVRLLGDLAAERPLLLVLDDLHAADAASLQLLHHLARAAAASRWLILGTYREEDLQAGGEFQRLCAAATREGLCRRIDLPRLARPACDRLVQTLLPGGAADPTLLDQLHALSLGNPLFVQELVRTMQERGDLGRVDGRWQALAAGADGVPRQVRALVEARVDRLGDDVRRALALAAVAGLECSFAVLRASELPEGSLLDALDRALAARVLEERGDGYAFRHPLFRAALYERLSQPRRTRLHAALAAAIEEQTGPSLAERPDAVVALAHHWDRAGEPQRAVPYLIRAGEHAAQVYANAEAIERFRRALALLDGAGRSVSAGPALRAGLFERLGGLYALTGENAAARHAYALALAAAPVPALAGARLQRKAGHQAILAGDLATAGEHLDQAAGQLGQAEPGRPQDLERARLLAVVAHRHWLASQFPEALAAAEASAHVAEAVGAEAERAQAYEMMALACLPLGEWQRGAEYERRRASLADLNREIMEAADVHL